MIRARVAGPLSAFADSLTAKSARIATAATQRRGLRASAGTAHWHKPGLLWPLLGKG
ncbi:hypothetical protein [Pontixanthobacter sp.]|uniref:hypothetical protein n=1 Tax=Pontixanthobacter sp. TaxID=2792078 RepID=UPI003C7AAB7D